MWGHAECNDVVLLAVELKFGRVVALMAIKDQQPVSACCTRCCMIVEVLDPIQAYLIGCPAIVGRRDTPIIRKITLSIPVGQVVLRGQYDERWYGPALSIHALDYRSPLAVARLGQLGLATAV